MSSVKNTHLSGDVSVGRNVATGGNVRIAGSTLIGHDLKVEGWLEAKNIRDVNKGIFPTLDSLQSSYPSPRTGWFAGVGTSSPFTAYVGLSGKWVPTGGTLDISVDMKKYSDDIAVLDEHVSGLKGIVEQLLLSLTNVSGRIDSVQSEFLRRLQGRSEHSEARTDPFQYIGNFTHTVVNGIVTEDRSEKLGNFLNSIYSSSSTPTYTGLLRGELDGQDFEVRQYVRQYSTEDCVQVARGLLNLDSRGYITNGVIYSEYVRYHNISKGWSKWKNLSGVSIDEIESLLRDSDYIVTGDHAGLMSVSDKKKLDAITHFGGSTGGSGSVSVIDRLDSDDTSSALSANQGRVLNAQLDVLGCWYKLTDGQTSDPGKPPIWEDEEGV